MLGMLGAFFLGAFLSVLFVSMYFSPRVRPRARRSPLPSPVLLVTAHPDDEAMFFAPTLLALKEAGAVVDLLCFSVGNFDGLGSTRVDELTESARRFGLREVRVIDSGEFPDDPQADWPQNKIAEVVRSVVAEFQSKSVITFDETGVSSHRNHCAIANSLVNAKESEQLSVPLFLLVSLPIFRKYCALLEFLHSLIFPSSGVIYVPLQHIPTAYTCMLAYPSQLAWFRWLYVIFSVYMYKNKLIKV